MQGGSVISGEQPSVEIISFIEKYPCGYMINSKLMYAVHKCPMSYDEPNILTEIKSGDFIA